MVGKVEAPEKANMMDPKAVKKDINELGRTAKVLFTLAFKLSNTLQIASPKLS